MTTDNCPDDNAPVPPWAKITLILFLLIPVFYLLSMLNGIVPFGRPPGTKTITSPTSIQKRCIED